MLLKKILFHIYVNFGGKATRDVECMLQTDVVSALAANQPGRRGRLRIGVASHHSSERAKRQLQITHLSDWMRVYQISAEFVFTSLWHVERRVDKQRSGCQVC